MHVQGDADKMAERLKYAMEERGITAAELARSAGCHKSSISMYLAGEHAASMRSAQRLADILHVNSAWLMGYDVPMTIEEPRIRTIDLGRSRFLQVDNTMINLDHIVTITHKDRGSVVVLLDTGGTVEGAIIES